MQDITPKELKCIRYLTNEMSTEDRSVFEIELSIDNELKALYLEYLNIWKAYPSNDLELHHEKIQQKIEGKIKQKIVPKKLYAYAALLLILIVSGFSIFFFSGESNYTNIKIAEAGERLRFKLPDSSDVVLNSGSKLKYAQNFDNPREVWLEGEGFFDVIKDPDRPFIVHTHDMKIKVLGTSFGINTFSEHQTVSLATGKVNVVLKPSNDEVNLLPNEQLTYSATTHEVTKRSFNPEKAMAWKENILLLDNLSLKNALPKINDFFGVQFSIKDKTLENQRITGAFKDQNLEEFISSMEFITNLRVIKKKPHHYLIIASDEN
ncbi:FecR family protein [Zunongwangia pacifica]|uniref:FecR domain-containing protein n=1 Tax=Zunongwangia pacifica TaxID=2911062 RepID=A0A9X2A112_9FLAO|nr:FecR domain-containing protein [Zunongwangia pacifica]MCL6218209.1 FecR domain-containing protein [Zunongwangia pacifica]